MTEFPIAAIRDQFPALALTDAGKARIYLDNPAGTQVPQRVIDRITGTLLRANANLGGDFVTSVAAEQVIADARQAMADMLNASPDEIVFGANMTTLTLHMSRALAARFRPGDEIVLSRMDHDANVTPWVLMARDRGLTVRWIDFDPEACEFPEDALDRALTDRTRLVAVGYASNCLGTINDVGAMARKAHAAGALMFVDAVQLAPHRPIDVAALECDLLVCSAYKFFGPHVGVLWGRRDLLADVTPYKVRPAPDSGPDKFETGTQNHEGIAGVAGAVEYFKAVATELAPAEVIAAHAGKREGVRLVHGALDWLARHFPDRAGRVESAIRAARGGALYDARFYARQRGAGPLAEQIAAAFRLFARRYSLDAPHSGKSNRWFLQKRAERARAASGPTLFDL